MRCILVQSFAVRIHVNLPFVAKIARYLAVVEIVTGSVHHQLGRRRLASGAV